jgi:hypothetical protein
VQRVQQGDWDGDVADQGVGCGSPVLALGSNRGALLSVPNARADQLAELDVEDYVSGASLLVHGTLGPKGELTVAQILYGKDPGERCLQVNGGAEIHECLARAFDHETPEHAAAFLNQVTALPRSADRARRLLTLLPDGAGDGSNAFNRTVKALTPDDPDEEAAVGTALWEAEEEGQPLLLRLIREVGYRGLWDKVAFFAERGHPPAVRRAAFQTLVDLDWERGTARSARLLRADDPELRWFLNVILRRAGRNEAAGRLSPEVAAALPFRGADLRRRPGERDLILVDEWYDPHPVLEALVDYGRPDCLPVLYDWAMDESDPNSGAARKRLARVAGRKDEGKDRRALAAWWEQARPLLERRYDLDTEAGRKAWREAYAVADEGT